MNNNLLCGGNCPYLCHLPGNQTATCNKYFCSLVNVTEYQYERAAPCIYNELFERVVELEETVKRVGRIAHAALLSD